MAAGPTFSLFFSYSHKDEALRDALEEHLALLKREGRVDAWHDRRIGAGREWEGQIDGRLETADLILLLISPSFMASDYCFDREMGRALERHDSGEARVIPVLLRPCDWKTARFAKLQGLPKDLQPVTRWPNQDEALLDVVSGIRQALEVPSDNDGNGSSRSDPIPPYLAKIARDHENLIPLFDRRRAPLLDHVYVELRLRNEERLRSLVDSEDWLLTKPMTIHEVLALDAEEHPWITRRWVVLGDPGAGKTTLARHLTRELALDSRRRLVPVFESLPRLLREKAWLLDRIETQMVQGGARARGLASTLDQMGEQGKLLVLLDGLDEVHRDQKDPALSLLRQLSDRWPSTPILVTSRPIGYHHPGEGFRELEVQQFDSEQQLSFLARWLGDETARARDALEAINTHPSVRDLAGNPLYLTLMAILLEQGESPSENRALLYDQIFDLLLEGRHKRPSQPMPLIDDCRQSLRRLGFAMTEANVHSEPVGLIERRFWNDGELRQLAQPLIACCGGVRSFLDALAEKTSILGPHDGRGADWRYWHRSFREALTAEVLGQFYETGGQKAILDVAHSIEGDESRWAEAFALLAGRVDEPDGLVKALVESKRDLGFRALASSPVLNVSTIGEVLALTEKLGERIEVLLKIPALLPDAPSALALIDRMRRDTKNGNDLYLLDLAAQQVAERPGWEDHARKAQLLRKRLYDHLPPPPKDLFESVETVDGCVPLWRRIPAGRFLMGSPRTEPGRDVDEGPQHEVVVKSDFWLAAVPVTQAQYAAFEPGHISHSKGGSRPVEQVTWFQAMAFCAWLAQGGFRGARLPTEEEWEYSCRADTTTRYWSGDSERDLRLVAWFGKGPHGKHRPVGEKPANSWGLYDVHGNVWEWTLSQWRSYAFQEDGRIVDPCNPRGGLSGFSPGAHKVIRGGSYWSFARVARSAYRGQRPPSFEDWYLGFRVMLPVAPCSLRPYL